MTMMVTMTDDVMTDATLSDQSSTAAHALTL